MPSEKTDPGCRHVTIGVLIAGIAFFIFFNRRDGFRSNQEKNVIAGKLITMNKKPGYETARSFGLDGAEFYQVRQLWNNRKYTAKDIAKVL